MLSTNQLVFISLSMDLSNQPYPIRSFLGKLKFFNAFNVVFCLWALAQTIYYSVITSLISCSQKPFCYLDMQLRDGNNRAYCLHFNRSKFKILSRRNGAGRTSCPLQVRGGDNCDGCCMEACRVVLYRLRDAGDHYCDECTVDHMLNSGDSFAMEDKKSSQRCVAEQFDPKEDFRVKLIDCTVYLGQFECLLIISIKEFIASMSDIFQIVEKEVPKVKKHHFKDSIIKRYTSLQGQFLTQSYGYYTEFFIEKIATQASNQESQIAVLSIHKILRDIVRKFMMSDLQLVFIGHVASLLEWRFTAAFYKHNHQIVKWTSEKLNKNVEILNFYLHLIAAFVKNYIGEFEHTLSIQDFLSSESDGKWEQVYQQWLEKCPEEMFKLSPREINSIYCRYTRNAQKPSASKDFNTMVDKILELSTTYSMMAGEGKQTKKNLPQISEEEQLQKPKKKVKKNIITEGFLSNISRKQESQNDIYFGQSRISNNLQSSAVKRKESVEINEPKVQKRPLLRLKSKPQQVSNHVKQFYAKKQFQMPNSRQDFRPESTIGFPNNSVPSLLDFNNNRSSIYEPIPYTLRNNNSNLSNFWK